MASGEGGIGWCRNPTIIIASLISGIKIVKYFGIVREGGGALKYYKMIMALPLSVIKIVKYCGVWVFFLSTHAP